MVNPLYQCEICRTSYPKRREAEKCEARGAPVPKFKIGDKVRAKKNYGLEEFDAEVIWVGNDNHTHVWYNIRAFDRVRFHSGGCFTRNEDELEGVS